MPCSPGGRPVVKEVRAVAVVVGATVIILLWFIFARLGTISFCSEILNFS